MVLQPPSAPSSPAHLLRTTIRQHGHDGDDSAQSQRAPHVYHGLRTHATTHRLRLAATLEVPSRWNRRSDKPQRSQVHPLSGFEQKPRPDPRKITTLPCPPQVWDATPPPPTDRRRRTAIRSISFFSSSLPPFNGGSGREHLLTLSLPATHRQTQWHGSVPLSQPQPKDGTVC